MIKAVSIQFFEDMERLRRSFALDTEHIATSRRCIAESMALLAKVSRLTEPASTEEMGQGWWMPVMQGAATIDARTPRR